MILVGRVLLELALFRSYSKSHFRPVAKEAVARSATTRHEQGAIDSLVVAIRKHKEVPL